MKTRFYVGTIGPTLIIKRDTGTFYCNQVNGLKSIQTTVKAS